MLYFKLGLAMTHKKSQTLIFLVSISIFILTCSKKKEVDPKKNKSSISINVNSGLKVNEIPADLKSTLGVEEFKVIIYSKSGEEVLLFDHVYELPESIELEPGEYYVVVHSNNLVPAAFESPYYYGRSEDLVLEENKHETVEITCKLANCAISIVYSDNVKQDFTSYFTEVSIEGEMLTFFEDEIRKGYFDLNPIHIKALLIYALSDGSTQNKMLTGDISNPVAGKLYEVVLDATVNNAQAAFTINLDETEVTQVITITGENDSSSASLTYGDLLITEIMYDPVSLSDTKGEWFEIYNNASFEINLNNLVIIKESAIHVISEEINLIPGAYYVMARSEDAVDCEKYVYGSDISLTNSGSELKIATYGTDGTNGIELASVRYDDGASFPDASGASLNLSLTHYDADEAKLGTSWCLATETYNTGDLGSPGLINNICE